MIVAVMGAGRLGGAMLSGLLRSGHAAQDIVVAERDADRAGEIVARHGVEVQAPTVAAAKADVLIIGVKPQDVGTLLAEIGSVVANGTLVVSLAAGITTDLLEERLPSLPPVVRVMTNTPLLVGEAMSAICGGRYAEEKHLATAEALLTPVGRVTRVAESQLDAVTALSGSGPAYFFYLVDAMIEAGVLLGLPRTLAAELMTQTALGSARMLRESGEHPALLREAVTSPAGTTIAALRELDRRGVRAALMDALEAASSRSRELGRS
ncbi:pyrroline-5-carboxylate reductase [Frankia casuarinae]|nr:MULTISPECIES: pyrroline-5-carboxylate reductase [Frankia]ETA04428.1 pyrroline-5-carboxylate reductase [Frankia sp. CcI6]EYT92320.1 pyrroline-5-carboxylate reductase [Frankia casuarinae]KDA42418.1 pyrroline-5-carboxylate reductase [Frankia sp. BMG5.23]KFB06524.1 pyrroline-5-carboxylate reductase [Frankia sp. Allo2]OAA29777.1 pyrroline-5-carboxylate reductase [Frankia casuarinae]